MIVGFAAQKSIANLLAGIQLAFTQPIRLDDMVVIDGERGVIEEINLTFVVVKIWDKRRLIIPISHFLENIFENWTRVSTDLLGTVDLHVDYDVPINELRKELKRIVEGSGLWDGTVEQITVTDTSDSGMVLRVLVSAENAGKLWDLRCLVREKMIEFVRDNYPAALPRTRIEVKTIGGS